MNESLARHTRWLVLGDIISRAIGVVAVIWLANYLDVLTYSALSYVFAIANIGVIIADGGLGAYIAKQLPRLEIHEQQQWLKSSMYVKLLLNTLSAVCVITAVLLLSDISIWVTTLGALVIIGSNTRMYLESWFRGWQIMQWDALSKIAGATILAVAILLGISLQLGLLGIAAVYAGAVWLSVLFTYILTLKYQPRATSTIENASGLSVSLSSVALSAWPFGVTLAINAFYNYFDSVMLGAYGYLYEVGIYTAVYKPIFFLTGIAGMVMSAHVPAISQLWQRRDLDAIRSIMINVSRILTGLAVAMAWGGLAIAPQLLTALYKDEYVAGAPIFSILVCSTACIYVWASYGNSLQAMDGERTYLRGFAYGLVITILGNIVFIPTFGMYAAAYTTLCTQVFLVWYMRRAVLAHTGWKSSQLPIWSFLLRANIAGFAMGCILWFVQLPAGWSVAMGGILYVLFSLGMRTLQNNDITFLKRLVRQ